MSRFSVAIVNYGRNPHARCFEDFASAMRDALILAGHDVVPHNDAKPGRLVVFGGNNLLDPEGKMPKDLIVYNSEQVSAKQQWNLMENLVAYRKHVVWDYAQTNVDWLKKNGVTQAMLCGVGYVPSMEKIKKVAEEDIDVLFYGSINAPRRKILDALHAAGLKVHALPVGTYGEERDSWIARSKVILNLHFYENPVFEIFRCSHLLANKKAVLTEDGGIDKSLEDFAKKACVYSTRDEIVDEALALCDDTVYRKEVEEKGYQEFKKIDLVENVRLAVAAST
jgi:hypothetical protein